MEEYKYMYIIVVISAVLYGTNAAVTFCTNSEANGDIIAMDGFYADTIPETFCSCIARSKKNQVLSIGVAESVFGNQFTNHCGSEIRVSHNDGALLLSCGSVYSSINIEENEEISFVLKKIKSPYDTRYCVILTQENASFSVSCTGYDLSSTMLYEKTITSTSRPLTDLKTQYEATYSSTLKPMTVYKTAMSNKPSANWIALTSVGWCFTLLLAIITIILIVNRGHHLKRIKELSTKSQLYDELSTSRDVSGYSVSCTQFTNTSEYKIVSADTV